jgi:hypothetical protein
MVATWITPKAVKGRDSAIAGRGLVATEAIAQGEVVAVKGGHIVITEDLRSLSEHLQNSDVQIADHLHLAARTEDEYESVMLFLNHSCEPNVGFGGNVLLVAMRDIESGEELTTDYAMFDDYDRSLECCCGRPACRGRIDGRTGSGPTSRRSTAVTSLGISPTDSPGSHRVEAALAHTVVGPPTLGGCPRVATDVPKRHNVRSARGSPASGRVCHRPWANGLGDAARRR